MSRCFPFLPPGYDKKIPTTQSDTLRKEKHREKKHKKEKKDKDKKDKKEKRRDKKKEKERDKDQQLDNLNTSVEARLKVPLQGQSGQNAIQKDSCSLPDDHMIPGRNTCYNEGYHGHYESLAEELNGAKFVHSVEGTVRDNTERGECNIMREKIVSFPHKRNEGYGRLYHNNHLGNDFEDSNLALELDRRLKNEAEQPYVQSQTADTPIGANQKRDGGVLKSVPSHLMVMDSKIITGSNGRYIGNKSGEVTLIQYTSGLGQGNHDRMKRLNCVIERKIEGQERINHPADELSQREKKRKENERNGDRKSHEKHKSREKDKMEAKSISRTDQKCTDQGRQKIRKTDILLPPNKEILHSGEYNVSSSSNDVKMKLVNGFLTNGAVTHVTGSSVLSRPSSLHGENGRAPEPYQVLAKPSIGGLGSSKMDKVGKINGTIRPVTERVVESRPRSPHPDAKQLADILVIPKIEEVSEIDNSDWLNCSKEGRGKKCKVDDSCVTTTTSADMPQVWSKATNIDSADVFALPYVIPY